MTSDALFGPDGTQPATGPAAAASSDSAGPAAAVHSVESAGVVQPATPAKPADSATADSATADSATADSATADALAVDVDWSDLPTPPEWPVVVVPDSTLAGRPAPPRRPAQPAHPAAPAATQHLPPRPYARPPIRDEEPSLLGLTRRSHSRAGSRLFTAVFVAIFLIILLQVITRLVTGG